MKIWGLVSAAIFLVSAALSCGSSTPTSTPLPTPARGATATPGPSEDVTSAENHYESGVALQEQGLLESAILEYELAIELDPQDEVVYTARGSAYNMLGEFERAIKDFSEAMRLNFRYALAHHYSGIAYLNLGDARRAVQNLNRAIEFDSPLLAESHATRAVAHALLGNDDAAQQDADRAVQSGVDPSRMAERITEARKQR